MRKSSTRRGPGGRRCALRSSSVALLVVGFLVYQFRYWPEERLVDKFFAALERKDFETAYGLYMADPAWQQHPQQYPLYPYNEFYRDWGPGGEWGLVKNYKIYATGECPHGGSGVIVEVIVNDRTSTSRSTCRRKRRRSARRRAVKR